jgi:hypothetical protein
LLVVVIAHCFVVVIVSSLCENCSSRSPAIVGRFSYSNSLLEVQFVFNYIWQELIDSQSQIGSWKQLLLGRFSMKWLEYQEQHLRINKKPFTNSNHGPSWWLSTLIIRVWNHCYVLWESRNKVKHGHDTETERAALLAQVKR